MRNNIRILREAKGLSKQELADKIGYSLGFLNNLELGNRRLNETVIKKLMEAFKCNIDDILGSETLGILNIPFYNNPKLTYKILQTNLDAEILSNLLAFQLEDDAMDEIMKIKDIVIIDTNIKNIHDIKKQQNAIFLIKINNSPLLRKVKYNNIKETFSIIATNTQYNNSDYSDIPESLFTARVQENKIEFIGKVVKIIASR